MQLSIIDLWVAWNRLWQFRRPATVKLSTSWHLNGWKSAWENCGGPINGLAIKHRFGHLRGKWKCSIHNYGARGWTIAYATLILAQISAMPTTAISVNLDLVSQTLALNTSHEAVKDEIHTCQTESNYVEVKHFQALFARWLLKSQPSNLGKRRRCNAATTRKGGWPYMQQHLETRRQLCVKPSSTSKQPERRPTYSLLLFSFEAMKAIFTLWFH